METLSKRLIYQSRDESPKMTSLQRHISRSNEPSSLRIPIIQNTRAPSFLTLPWDIRSQILEGLLRSDRPLCKISRIVTIRENHWLDQGDIRYWRFELGHKMGLHPEILACCRQLYQEGSSVLYANTVVVSMAMYPHFSPLDVLGYWRSEDVTCPTDGGSAPILGRFRNIEFRLYINFPYTVDRKHYDDAFNDLCRAMCENGCHRFNRVEAIITDGSWHARDTIAGTTWAEPLLGLSTLSYDSCTLTGNVPDGVTTIENISRICEAGIKTESAHLQALRERARDRENYLSGRRAIRRYR